MIVTGCGGERLHCGLYTNTLFWYTIHKPESRGLRRPGHSIIREEWIFVNGIFQRKEKYIKKILLHAHICEVLVRLGMYLCAKDKLRIIKIIISLVIINEGSFLCTHSFSSPSCHIIQFFSTPKPKLGSCVHACISYKDNHNIQCLSHCHINSFINKGLNLTTFYTQRMENMATKRAGGPNTRRINYVWPARRQHIDFEEETRRI